MGALLAAVFGQAAWAQSAPATAALVDDLQTTYLIDRYREVADSGPARGETIYFYKCWACHNSLAEDAGPPLKNLFDRPVLMSGVPLDEKSVAARVRQGGERMPGFARISDADLADLFSYLRSDACCYEALEPPANPRYQAAAHQWPVPSSLKGGPTGIVRASATGQLLEGIKVQLIAPNGVRTTVFSNAEGEYEFPRLQSGAYTLRIATPVPYMPYRRDSVRVDVAKALEDILLETVPDPTGGPRMAPPPGVAVMAGALVPTPEANLPGALPPTQEIFSQLSGAEMLWNLPGTVQEKAAFATACGVGCHGYQQILRNRFDEHGWRVMIDRMLGYGGNELIHRRKGYYFASKQEVETIVKWLAKVRGPDSADVPFRQFPRPSGAATRVVITEYEMPRRLLSIHDTYADAKGNIWYTSHRTPYAGVLDPRTGIVTEHKMPPTPGDLPGTHAVEVDDKHGYAWFSENWADRYSRLTLATGEIKAFSVRKLDIGTANFALAPDGFLWANRYKDKTVVRVDPNTFEIVAAYPLNNPIPYQNAVSSDGRFWAGGAAPRMGGNTGMILDIRTGKMYEANSGDRLHAGGRGGFVPKGHNAWFGGRDGMLEEVVNEIDEGKGVRIRAYQPPTPPFPYTVFYTAKPDINGQVWGGVLHGRGFVRYNTRTQQWITYENPEPSALARNIFIDNKTKPATVWYPDNHTGLIVRIQALD
jgi:streptogramin lyase/mono/diheme cytochrome c family protein